MEAGELAAQGSTLTSLEEHLGSPVPSLDTPALCLGVVWGSIENKPAAATGKLLLNTGLAEWSGEGQEEFTVSMGCVCRCLKRCFDKFPCQRAVRLYTLAAVQGS